MLESIHFKNYRCFSDHYIPLNTETIIVGKNNAGKSTIVEGLRLVSIITERYKNLAFRKVPDWSGLPIAHKGVGVSLTNFNINWQNIFHQYQDYPGQIIAKFSNGYKLTIHIGPDKKIHSVIQKSNNHVIKNKIEAKLYNLPIISVLPQISPIQKEENILTTDYVKANISSHLSSNHFRNQLHLFYDDYFEEFKSLAEDNWPGLQIIGLEIQRNIPGEPIELLIRDGDFVSEIGWMGHGLQMWLQTIWFITRSKNSSTIILDEPDVYMHPDLQRKLVRFIRGRNSQSIIATHSTEILAETNPNNILIIDRSRENSFFATSLPAVQKILEGIGSAQNLHLTRLWSAGRLLLVEGKDIKLLKQFQNLLFPNTKHPFDALPNMPIGGWSGWQYAVGSAMLLNNAFDEQISTYCVLDSDYYLESKINKRYEEAAKKNVNLHIWNKKEIENYLINPIVIQRIISKNCKNGSPTIADIETAILEITSSLKDQTIDCFSQEYNNEERDKGIASANKKARLLVDNHWGSMSDRLCIVSGKKTISMLSAWATVNYQVSFGINTLLYEIQPNELDHEVVSVIHAIENSVKIAR
jgi:energy-coupling factor transporter ATP-binding protein EcfA2